MSPENANAPDASVVIVRGTSAWEIVTVAEATACEEPACRTLPVNVPDGVVGVVGVVVAAGATVLGLHEAPKETINTSIGILKPIAEDNIPRELLPVLVEKVKRT
jgi:hypothetical protein